jgi:starch phosphorylase
MPIDDKVRPLRADIVEGITGTASDESDIAEIKSAVLAKLTLAAGKDPSAATDRDWFVAAALTVRDRVVHRWLTTERASRGKGSKRVYYLSLEFLMGRLFDEVLVNLGLGEIVCAALGDLGVDLARLRASEPDAALGNGGLGRLAACFLESMATLGIPACGYGIRYDHGLFRQVIRDGWQQEYPEEWLSFGNPWEFARPEAIYDIHFGGRVERTVGPGGIARSVWHPDEIIEAVAYDTPVVGWRGRHVNLVRLWSARAADPMRLDAFNQANMWLRYRNRHGRRRSRRLCTRATRRRRGRSCGCGRNIFSSPRRCKIWCTGICAPMATFSSFPTTLRFSSTTHIQASPSPS